MFNFFRKRKKIVRPDIYARIITIDKYQDFLKKCIKILKELGYEVTDFEDGKIVYKINNEESHFFLDSLVREYSKTVDEEKDTIITDFFSKFQNQSSAFIFFYKDFGQSKSRLGILFQPTHFFPDKDQYIFQNQLPKLQSFLILDYDNKLHYVNRKKAAIWGKDDNFLFTIALENLSKEKVDIKKIISDYDYEIYKLIHKDLASTYTLLVEQKLQYTIGHYGSIVALPTKGTAL